MNIDISLLPYQEDILNSTANRKAMICGTGTGKTYFLPRFLFVEMMENPGQQAIVSAPTIPMLKRNPLDYFLKFFDESGIKETKKTPKANQYKLNKSEMTIDLACGKIHFIAAEKEMPKRMQGVHARWIIGDEAGLYPRLWFDTAVQRLAFTGGDLVLFTTWYELNWMYTDFYEKWLQGDPNYFIVEPKTIENPYFPLSGILQAKADMPVKLYEMFYENKIPTRGTNQLLDIHDLKSIFNSIIRDDYHEKVITCDVADEGADFSYLVAWDGYREIENLTIENSTQPELERILKTYSDRHNARIILDSTGIGTAVGQYLRESKYNCQSVNFSSNAKKKKTYENIRAEMYFEMQKAVKNKTLSLKKNTRTEKELLAQKWKINTSSRRFQMEDKKLIKKDLGFSPDKADSYALRFVNRKSSGLLIA